MMTEQEPSPNTSKIFVNLEPAKDNGTEYPSLPAVAIMPTQELISSTLTSPNHVKDRSTPSDILPSPKESIKERENALDSHTEKTSIETPSSAMEKQARHVVNNNRPVRMKGASRKLADYSMEY